MFCTMCFTVWRPLLAESHWGWQAIPAAAYESVIAFLHPIDATVPSTAKLLQVYYMTFQFNGYWNDKKQCISGENPISGSVSGGLYAAHSSRQCSVELGGLSDSGQCRVSCQTLSTATAPQISFTMMLSIIKYSGRRIRTAASTHCFDFATEYL